MSLHCPLGSRAASLLLFAVLCVANAKLDAQTVFQMPFSDDFEGMMNWDIPPLAGHTNACGTCGPTIRSA